MKRLKIRGTPVLFTEKDSIYKKIGCDCFDEKRDARTFKGGKVAIYHPPCRLFSKLSKLSTAPINEKELAYWAVEMVKSNGGILEHPEHSKLWKELNLPVPGQVSKSGLFSIEIDQYSFGHPCQKKTWLLISGCEIGDLPLIPVTMGKSFFHVARSRGWEKSFELQKQLRAHTPLNLALWLILVTKIIEEKRK